MRIAFPPRRCDPTVHCVNHMYPFARGGLFQLEVLRDGAVAFILRDIVVVRVCTAADVQIQTASYILKEYTVPSTSPTGSE